MEAENKKPGLEAGYGAFGGTGNNGILGSYGPSSFNFNMSSQNSAAKSESLYVMVPTPGNSRSLGRSLPLYDANKYGKTENMGSSFTNIIPTSTSSNAAAGQSTGSQGPSD